MFATKSKKYVSVFFCMISFLFHSNEKLKEPTKEPPRRPDFWIETCDSVSQICRFDSNGRLSVTIASDSRPIIQRVVESFLNKFFPSGYPYSVNEGYLTYTQFRALQHFSSAALFVLSTQVFSFCLIPSSCVSMENGILKLDERLTILKFNCYTIINICLQ
ncbi:hypothetical protein ZIOFF_030971 [Zingiber officinale]|uniref:Protein root UVB sensitive/RUS domain-containing protein n=1 Tax=Zingiber officinale TaxID=94328 RepID=A0A8J5GQ79_ZINOF|nr:hypothetical protein ZIOFF_030971 [Zingiber officinale]